MWSREWFFKMLYRQRWVVRRDVQEAGGLALDAEDLVLQLGGCKVGENVGHKAGDVGYVSECSFLVPFAEDPDFPGGDVEEPRYKCYEIAGLEIQALVL